MLGERCGSPSTGPLIHPLPNQVEYEINTTYTYHCIHGYEPTTNPVTRCMSDLTWSSSPPACTSQ